MNNVTMNKEPTGFNCGKCGDAPGIIYVGDVGDYLCNDCFDDYKSIVESGYSVSDWYAELY